MDILFNNAGIAPGGWFDEMELSVLEQTISVNVLGVIYGTRAALPFLKVTDNSLCISTSSSVATYGHARRVVYSASKFAVKGLTEALSLEFERFGIRVADVLPGCIDTPMLRRETARGRPFHESMLDALPKAGLIDSCRLVLSQKLSGLLTKTVPGYTSTCQRKLVILTG